MTYKFKPSALKDLKKLQQDIQKRVIDKLDFYTADQNPLRFAKFIEDKQLGSFRYRVGDYRIVFDIVDESLIVLAIAHRKDIYQ